MLQYHPTGSGFDASSSGRRTYAEPYVTVLLLFYSWFATTGSTIAVKINVLPQFAAVAGKIGIGRF